MGSGTWLESSLGAPTRAGPTNVSDNFWATKFMTTFGPTNFLDNVWATNFSDNLSEIYVSYSQNRLVRACLCYVAILIALHQDKNFNFEDSKTVVIFSENRRQVQHTLLALQCILYIDFLQMFNKA